MTATLLGGNVKQLHHWGENLPRVASSSLGRIYMMGSTLASQPYSKAVLCWHLYLDSRLGLVQLSQRNSRVSYYGTRQCPRIGASHSYKHLTPACSRWSQINLSWLQQLLSSACKQHRHKITKCLNWIKLWKPVCIWHDPFLTREWVGLPTYFRFVTKFLCDRWPSLDSNQRPPQGREWPFPFWHHPQCSQTGVAFLQ